MNEKNLNENIYLDKIKSFLKKQNIKYNSVFLYRDALTHTTFVHENSNKDFNSYERLEFLGDAILGKVVVEYLFKKYPNHNEGEMTLMKHFFVKKDFLAATGKRLEIEKYMLLGKGSIKEGISDSIYENVIESLIGAIYIDLGIKEVEKFIHKNILSQESKIKNKNLKDYKTRLQEYLQSESRKSIIYKTNKNPNNKNEFISKIIFDNGTLGEGKGKNKMESEQKAAKSALDKIAI